MSSAECVVREARPEDKQAVVDIHGDVYNGLDYLKDYYDHFMTADHITGYVCVLAGEIVAFVAACIVDDGRTVVDRAGRVKVGYQGQGVYTHMLSEIRKRYLPSDVLRKSIGISTPGYKSALRDEDILFQRNIQFFRPGTTGVTGVSNRAITGIDSYHFLSESGLSKLLQDDRIVSYLFPDQPMLVDWVPYQVLPSNISLMFGKDTVFVSDVTIDEETKSASGLLTAGTYVTTLSKGHNFIFDIFGLNAQSLEAHLSLHLNRLLKSKRDFQQITVVVDLKFDVQLLKKVFDSFGCSFDQNFTASFPVLKQYEMTL